MTASEREEKKGDQSRQLNPFFQIPAALQKQLKLEIDPHTRSLIEMGDYKEWSAEGEKKEEGQQYVVAFVIKDGVIHLRVNPSFTRVVTESARKNEDFIKLRQQIAEHFKCKPEEVIFPNDQTWTGVVHTALTENIKNREPDLVQDAVFASLSFTKKDGVFYWKNRSAKNAQVFSPDPLALLCYMFDPDCIKNPKPDWDLYYHLQRAVPGKLLTTVVADTAKEIGGKADLTDCTNSDFEDKWEVIREQFNKDRPGTEKKINEMIMTNLYIYLLNLNSTRFKNVVERNIEKGFLAADLHGIAIDMDYIPPEFKDKNKTALDLAIEKNDQKMIDLILSTSLVSALKNGDKEKARKAADKIFELMWRDEKFAAIKNELKELIDSMLSDEKINLNKTNKEGKTLFHIVSGINDDKAGCLFELLFKNCSDKNVLDNNGRSPLYYAVAAGAHQKVHDMVNAGINPHVADKNGQTAFMQALSNNVRSTGYTAAVVTIMLESPFQFPASYIDNKYILSELSRELGKRIPSMQVVGGVFNAIKIQTDPNTKKMLLDAIMNALNWALSWSNYSLAAEIMRKVTEADLALISYDYSGLKDALYNGINKSFCSDTRDKNQFFAMLTDEKNPIGSRLFTKSQDAEFKTIVVKQKSRIEMITQFLDLADSGDIVKARQFVRNLPEQLREQLYSADIGDFYQLFAQILGADIPDWHMKPSYPEKELHEMRGQTRDGINGALSAKINTLTYYPNDWEYSIIVYLQKNKINDVKNVINIISKAENDYIEMKLPISKTTTPEFRQHLTTVLNAPKPDFNQENKQGETLLDLLAKCSGEHVEGIFIELFSKIELDKGKLQKIFLKFLEASTDTPTKIKLIEAVKDSKNNLSVRLMTSDATSDSAMFVSLTKVFAQRLDEMHKSLVSTIKPTLSS